MIRKTPEGRTVFYTLMPLEILLQLTAAGVLALHFLDKLASEPLRQFLFVILGVSLVRLAGLYYLKHQEDNDRLSTGFVDAAFIAGNIAMGLTWGAGLPFMAAYAPEISLADPYIPVVLMGVTMASLAGSGLWSWLFFAFATPALSIPVVWWAMQGEFVQAAIWGFALLVAWLLYWSSEKVEKAMDRYRKLGQQHSGLLQELANARDEAVQNHRKIEQAHQSLISHVRELESAKEKIRRSEQETTRILNDMRDTYFRVDAGGVVRRISPSLQFLLGMNADGMIGHLWRDVFVNNAEYEVFLQALQDGFGYLDNFECRLRHIVGNEVWVSFSAHYSADGADATKGYEGTARDVTDKRRAAETLFQEKERLHVTLESIADGVVTTDMKGAVEYLNPTAEHMTGWSREEAKGKPLAAVLRLLDEKQRSPVLLPIDQWIEKGQRTVLANPALLYSNSQQREFAIELTGAPICDSKGATVGTVLVFHNVTKLRSLAQQLSYQAAHDELTGLINRREFEQRVLQAIDSGQADDKHHALLYIDLDQFKVVNDTCGHQAGDQLLKQVTARLHEMLRESDTLARLGGDEFGVLLMGCSIERATEVAENLRHAVDTFRFNWEDRAFRVGASIGLVPITKATTGLTELLGAADAACYVAKDGGRNQVHVYQQNDALVAQHQGQMQWIQRIQQALEENSFELSFQPIVSLRNTIQSSCMGELLLRMRDTQDPTGNKIIHPGAFIPAAERYQLMPKIDRWVISHALEALEQRHEMVSQLDACTINLSGQSLSDQKLLDYVLDALKHSSVAPSLLCFEITESAVISDLDVARRFIMRLKDIGCRFALDDFGSGLSSFEYLKNLPVDFLKLDGSMVREVAVDKVSHAMVESVNTVAHVMGMLTIAEHVESKEVLETLHAIGVDYVQGYAVEMPRPLFRYGQRMPVKAAS